MEPFSFLRTAQAPQARGFTLIEMVTVLAIITILLSVVLVTQTGFNRSLLVTDTAYTVALTIRESQSLGLSSRNFGGFQNEGYGVHFSSGTPNSYIEFADIANVTPFTTSTITWCPVGTSGTPNFKPGNCLYDGSSELIQQYNFNQGFTISNFCAYNSAGALIGCSNNVNGISTLDIMFQRPNTTTIMTAITTNNVPLPAATACITVSTPDLQGFRYVEVNQLGEVSVLSQSCP
jgi:prepilin-type N-terminal cleavage/methylation domain-containing protein